MPLVWATLVAAAISAIGIIWAVLAAAGRENTTEPPPRIVWITIRPIRTDRSTVNGTPLPKPLTWHLHDDPDRTESLDWPIASRPHFSRGEWT